MSASTRGPRAVIEEAAGVARRYIAEAVGFDVDDTPDTLPVVDHYLGQIPADRPEVRDLIAGAVGCYFGEVLRSAMNAEWDVEDDDPRTWRMHLSEFSVSFYPVGIVYQAMVRGEEDDDQSYDDSVYVDHVAKPFVHRALESQPPVSIEEYYSLSGRFDSLHTIIDLITRFRAAQKADQS